jgi:hypothetical protein
MPFEWIESLFLFFLNNKDYSVIRDQYLKMKAEKDMIYEREKNVDEIHDDLIDFLGYDEKKAEEIMKELKGMPI